MNSYTKMSFRLFNKTVENVHPYFPEIKVNLKRAKMKLSVQEYISVAIMTSFIIFLISLPIYAFLFGFFFQNFLFSFISSFTASVFTTIGAFFMIIYYPQMIINQKAKEIDNNLPFAALYLATVSSSKLPLYKTFEIFSKFSEYGELTKEVNMITNDMEAFGLDINTALERAVDRTGSKNFKELLWGLLSTVRSGGNLNIYLKEKSKTFINEYRRQLYEFSHSLTIYIEIYLTSIVLGTIFFTILSAIMSGISGMGAGSVIMLQFFLIFVFLPMISMLFVFLVKSITPGGE